MTQPRLSVGAYRRLRSRGKSTPEGRVLKGCLDLLKLLGVLAWRSNNAPVPIRGAGGVVTGFRKTKVPGLPDILGVLPGGRFLAVECKAPGEGPTSEQRAFLEAIEKAGGVAIVARSSSELAEALRPYLMSSRAC